jgi:hypothetical protein
MTKAIATFAECDYPSLPLSHLEMVSVVVSICTRKMFADARKVFVCARDAEQDVRERQASMNFCVYFMFV